MNEPGTTSDFIAQCVSCGARLHGRYCHACGERVIDAGEFRLRRFLQQALHGVFDVDSRLLRSLRALLRRPGLLTAEYMAGRRRAWLGPLQLFLIVNLVFFATLSLVGGVSTFTTQLRLHQRTMLYGGVANTLIARAGAPGSAEAIAFEQKFNEAVPRYANSMVIVLAPIFAGICALLLARRGYGYVQHLVFALHFLAFLLIALLLVPSAIRLLDLAAPAILPTDDTVEFLLTITLTVIFTAYLAVATGRAYAVGKRRAFVTALILSLLLVPTLVIYRMILFFTVYFAVR